MRCGLVGHGAVGELHVAALRAAGSDVVAVAGRTAADASPFADRHGIDRAVAVDDLWSLVDAVVICSPTPEHTQHAESALAHGRHALVELPATLSADDGRRLGALAARARAVLCCAHTSRYLPAYRDLATRVAAGDIGTVIAVSYERAVRLRDKRWLDDALAHHAAHALDVLDLIDGPLTMVRAAIGPTTSAPRVVRLVVRTATGVSATVGVTYDEPWARGACVVTGTRGALVTDGFTFLRRVDGGGAAQAPTDATGSYASAIAAQDLDFLQACRRSADGVSWDVTVRQLELVETARRLAADAPRLDALDDVPDR